MSRPSFRWLARAAVVPRLDDAVVAPTYRRLRWQVFAAVYLGYASFYVVRKNVATVMPALLVEYGASKAQLGLVLSLFSATYALAKLVNGPLCDRANPRAFMALGLLGAVACNFAAGIHASLALFGGLWLANGFFQSMGSPVGPKSIANWFSSGERGRVYALWNTCHNLGAFLILAGGGFVVEFLGWRAGFFVPAAAAALGALVVVRFLRDRPESEGLPSIQEYHGDVPPATPQDTDESAFTIFKTYVLSNARIWTLALACMLIYVVRYGVGDWGVTYLAEAKGTSIGAGGLQSSFLELFGLPGTLLAGFLADRCFRGRNVAVAAIYLVGACAATVLVFLVPPVFPLAQAAAFGAVGFFVYGAQMVCSGLAPLELVPRRAVASAVGLTGALSYLGAVLASAMSGWLVDHGGWRAVFVFWTSCGALAAIVLVPLLRRPGGPPLAGPPASTARDDTPAG